MPEGTDNEHIDLADCFIFEVVALVDAFSEPLLNWNVPIIDFFSYMNWSLDYVRIDCIDFLEIFAAVADTRGVDCAHTEFPSEIVSTTSETASDKDIPKDVPKTIVNELIGSHPS